MADKHPKSQARRAKITREGRVFVFLTVGVAFAAINTGNNLIYLTLGLLLSLILLSMVMSELIMERIAVERLPPVRAFSGEPTTVRYVAENDRKYTPSYSLEISDRIEGEEHTRGSYILKIAPGERVEAAHSRVPKRRGLHHVRGYRMRTRYPFGIVEKHKSYDQPVDWIVYPKLLAAEHQWPDFQRTGDERSLEKPGPGSELGALRAYRAGDEARTIHWRRSAALGELVVRERDRETSALVQIFIDNAAPARPSKTWDAWFEDSVSRAAWLAREAVSRGAAAEVVTRSGKSPIALSVTTLDPVWRYLALLEPVAAVEARDPALKRGAHVVRASEPPPAMS
jgi:uncharacterized protein (DUF58 family)